MFYQGDAAGPAAEPSAESALASSAESSIGAEREAAGDDGVPDHWFAELTEGEREARLAARAYSRWSSWSGDDEPPPDTGRSAAAVVALIDALGDDRAAAETLSLPPGPASTAALEQLDLHELGDAALAATVAAHRRNAAWSHARSAQAAALLAQRPSMTPAWPEVAGDVRQRNLAGLELAMELGVSRGAGDRLVALGAALAGPLWPTGEALERGEIDEQKAHLVERALRDVALPVAIAVQEVVLPRAGRRTHTQLAADLQRALIEVDGREANRRHERARATRCVRRPKVLPDGMAGVWAVLPAHAAMSLWSRLDGVARAVRADGDDRTIEQLRADVLATAVLGDRATGAAPDSADGADSADGQGDPTEVPSLEALLAAQAVDVRVLVPADCLLDESRIAAHLDGYGAIPPTVARALAAGGVWRRLVTDPLSGAVLDVGRTRYRPTAAISEHVRLRDVTCARPGCSTAADACDLDHRLAWDDGGVTAAQNMNPLCRRDHLAKTHGGHHLRREDDGTVVWTTPTGAIRRGEPEQRGRPLGTSWLDDESPPF